MERASDKHSPRLDEAMADDTRSMVQGAPVEAREREERLQEGGEGTEAVLDPGLAEGRDLRSELARHLRPSVFPADRARLVAVATEEHAPDPVLALLDTLPAGAEFPNLEAVWEAIGGRPEQRA